MTLLHVNFFTLRFQIDPNSPYAKPVKRTNAALRSGEVKGQELAKELKLACAEAISETKAAPDSTEDQNLTEGQMALRYSGDTNLYFNHLVDMWNSLPMFIRVEQNISTFKMQACI